MQEPDNKLDIDSFWEYADPAASEERFRAALDTAQGDVRLELLTQIARTYGLRRRFDEAHALLNEIESQLAAAGVRPRIHTLLERGRAFNSNGEKEKARGHFIDAWETAAAAGEEGLAVDAAHMVAITCAGESGSTAWNERGLAMARQSQDRKAQSLIPAMLNNGAWDLHDMGRYAEALTWFKAALNEWVARDQPAQIQIAKWSLARCLRSLARHQEALTILRKLEVEHAAAGSEDGYVFEEMAENLAALGQGDAAKPCFKKAFDALNRDDWFVQNEAQRLSNLASRAK